MDNNNQPQISAQQAQVSSKNLYTDLFSLESTAQIVLFEIDISVLGLDIGIISQTEINQQNNTIFRFHNMNKFGNTSIIWQGNEYILAPIIGEGFDISSKGTLPIPKLSISVGEDGVTLLSALKQRINQLGRDLSGAKVTRIRTFAKYLDAANFFNNQSPPGFSPDPNAELPRDIFYIDRIVTENKNYIQWELGSNLDLENVKLPARIVSTISCPWFYRGFGCLYEFNARRNPKIHGCVGESTLPNQAPPVATVLNEFIPDLIGDVPYNDRGEYNTGITYNKGDIVYILNKGLKYYFVAKANNITVAPPDSNNWIADECSKDVVGCALRWKSIGAGSLPFGGYPSVARYQ